MESPYRLRAKYELVRPDGLGVLLDLDGIQHTVCYARMIFHGRRERTKVLCLQAGFKEIANITSTSDNGQVIHGGVRETKIVPRLHSIVEISRESWDGQAHDFFERDETILGSLDEYQPTDRITFVPRQLKFGGFVVFGRSNGRPYKIIKLPLMHLALRQA
ncbi:MAG: hypothetical protein ABIB04_04900 [Patescibacteria group bacterium]